ncbi:hypothetical protein PBY51_007996 [Eleginops maclovinus]|uniref:Immunoglobulin V-set domain-containing protein n=1 Tax=Eleginops maclovinus TaxID=56733 RepID=A0AAN7X2I4_ELEMC|nr:hypothetical protein PBY51_007996 [Eleginops maclovinus]
MSAVCLKIVTILCLSGTVMSGEGSREVVWREIGGHFTIQCRPPKADQEKMCLKRGLNKEAEVFFINGKSGKKTIVNDFRDRLEFNGLFPEIDILIKNLTSEDTGPYWCEYKAFDKTSVITKNGQGSVLLVVRETQILSSTDRSVRQCEDSDNTLILVSVVICAAVLLGIIICFFVWIIPKIKRQQSAEKLRRVATNEVYEDMRGTIRR